MLELFFTFFKIGLFTFGGGYAMIALIEDTCVEKKQWITHEQMLDIAVIAESTPGPIAINCATFVGYQRRGFPGALAATLGVVCPSFCIIYAISLFLDQFLAIPLIAGAFRGIQLGVGLLILNAGITMLRKMKKTPLSLGICLGAMVFMVLIDLFCWSISSITLMLTAGCVALLLYAVKGKGGGA